VRRRAVRRTVVSIVIAALALAGVALFLSNPRARCALRIAPGFTRHEADSRIYYETGAEEIASRLADALPRAVARVESTLSMPFRSDFRVYLCNTHESFAAHAGHHRSTPVRGLAFSRDIWVSPKAFSFHGRDTHEQTLAHELTHLHVGQQVGWLHRVRFLPGWFLEGLADWVSGTGLEVVSRDRALSALLYGPRLELDSTGRFPVPKGPSDYGIDGHMLHAQSLMFVEYLSVGREEAFRGLVRDVLTGERFGPAFEQRYGRTLDEEWAEFLKSLGGEAEGRDARLPSPPGETT